MNSDVRLKRAMTLVGFVVLAGQTTACSSRSEQTSEKEPVASARSATINYTPGDIDGDGRADISLVGGKDASGTWSSVPLIFSRMTSNNPNFVLTNSGNQDSYYFELAAAAANAVPIVGDFDGDGDADIALTGGDSNQIPLAFSNRDGTYKYVTWAAGSFPSTVAQTAGPQVVAGDFDGNGTTDLALVRPGLGVEVVYFGVYVVDAGGGAPQLKTALLDGDALTFANFMTNGAKVVAADFDNDGIADLALTGTPGWKSIPVLFMHADGSTVVHNNYVASFPYYASLGGQIVVGDFDGDHKGDIAVVGGYDNGVALSMIPVAYSDGTGDFRFTPYTPTGDSGFMTWVHQGRPEVVAGDFNGDGYSDLALVGGTWWDGSSYQAWTTVPVAMAVGPGQFYATNYAGVPDFAKFAGETGSNGLPTALSASESRQPPTKY